MIDTNAQLNRTPGRRLLRTLVAAVALATCLALPTAASAQDDGFIRSWEAGVYENPGGFVANAVGAFDPLSGSHPFIARTDVRVKELGNGALEYLRTLRVETPTGLVINPQAVPTCKRAQFYWRTDGARPCPDETQVGWVDLPGVTGSPYRVYNIEPRRGVPAEFGFLATAVPVFIQGRVGPDGTIHAISPDNGFGNNVRGVDFRLYGIPQDPAHGTGSTLTRRPLVTTPTSCVGPVDTVLDINSWQDPVFERHVSTTPVGGTRCEELPFDPTASVRSTSEAAGQPTGLDFQVDIPYRDDPDGRATAHIKSVEVSLPEGMTVNPASADGLAGCTPAQMNLASTDPVTCPDGAKIGSVEVETPLLKEEVGGSVYLAQPYDNPFGSLLGLYVVAENAERGVRLKIPGRIDADPATGQLTATFDDNPQLPYTSLRVSMNGGQRAQLMNPRECGTHDVVTRIAPWSAADPENPTEGEIVQQTSQLRVTGCGTAFSPLLAAGTENREARSSSPFLLSVARDDRDQEISSIRDIELPTGLLGNISTVKVCSAVAADAGACGIGSRIGHVQTAVGAGAYPAWLPQPGKSPASVSLAGPYRGAPYSLSVVVPAQAGPFDLGRVVARAPLNVDRATAQLSSEVAQSRHYDRHGNLAQVLEGRLPTILEGIPLRVREIRVIADRPGFMVNPSDCSPKQVQATVVSVAGARAGTSNRFQAAACEALPFKPRIGMRLRGRKQVRTGKHPALRAVVRQQGIGEAGIQRVVAKLPKSLALDPDNAQALCEFEDGTRPDLEDHCPKGSIVGRARAVSPLLKEPLVGNVYFVKNVRIDPDTGNEIRTLPMIVTALRGEIAINLRGESDVDKSGRLVNTFKAVPDAPIARFNLNLRGGRNGILTVTRTRRSTINLCAKPRSHVADLVANGQNGKRHAFDTRLKTPCAKKRKAGLKVGKAELAGGKVLVTGRVAKAARAGKGKVRVTLRCKAGKVVRAAKPNRRGFFKRAVSAGRCAGSKARIVIAYNGKGAGKARAAKRVSRS